MKEQTQDAGSHPPKGFRPIYLLGFLALVAGVAVGAMFVFRAKLHPETAQETGSELSLKSLSPAEANLQTKGATGSAVLDQAALVELIRTLKDASLPLAERQKAILALARNGSPGALAALKEALGSSAADIRRAIAEALAECPSPEGVTLLVSLLKDSDVNVAQAAVEALARQEQPQAATALAQLVNDSSSSTTLRRDAAFALGALREPWILDPLSRAAKESHDEDIISAALEGIGGLDFETTKGFFREFLQSADISCELKAAAIDALGQSEGDPTALLADLAAKDPDAEIRLAAALAMSTTEVQGNAGAEVLAMLSNEADPDVRLRLYQALGNQQSFDALSAMAVAQKEFDPSARIAAMDPLARAMRDNPSPQLQNYFNQTAIPELKQIALHGQNLDDRQFAVLVLARAHTPESMAALSDVQSRLAQKPNPAP